jgi:hypothetical protein
MGNLINVDFTPYTPRVLPASLLAESLAVAQASRGGVSSLQSRPPQIGRKEVATPPSPSSPPPSRPRLSVEYYPILPVGNDIIISWKPRGKRKTARLDCNRARNRTKLVDCLNTHKDGAINSAFSVGVSSVSFPFEHVYGRVNLYVVPNFHVDSGRVERNACLLVEEGVDDVVFALSQLDAGGVNIPDDIDHEAAAAAAAAVQSRSTGLFSNVWHMLTGDILDDDDGDDDGGGGGAIVEINRAAAAAAAAAALPVDPESIERVVRVTVLLRSGEQITFNDVVFSATAVRQ